MHTLTKLCGFMSTSVSTSLSAAESTSNSRPLFSAPLRLIQPPSDEQVVGDYHAYIRQLPFPCVAAKAALNKGQLHSVVLPDMMDTTSVPQALAGIYEFIQRYKSHPVLFRSVALLFKQPRPLSVDNYETLFWKYLQALHDADSRQFGWDTRVESNIHSPKFSFSLGEEAFFVVGLHPNSPRTARQFQYPAIVLNPHHQFEQLRQNKLFQTLKQAIRGRDKAAYGSTNPMLDDFGQSTEALQYTGQCYDDTHPFCPNLTIYAHGHTC